MSVVSGSASYLASAIGNNSAERETFQKFFECWLAEQNAYLQDLISAASANADAAGSPSSRAEVALRPLVDRVVEHYERYYSAKARWAQRDVLAMLTPAWRSSLEDAFMWIGGWRPSMAFHLLYSKSGLQLEASGKLGDLISGAPTMAENLADISPAQLSAVDELQRGTIRQEREISEDMARHQETVAGSDMVELSHSLTELLAANGAETAEEEEPVESALRPRERGLEDVLERADQLRLKTLKAILDVLTPIQAVHFLIAAAELHLRIHDWGTKRDATRRDHDHARNSPTLRSPN